MCMQGVCPTDIGVMMLVLQWFPTFLARARAWAAQELRVLKEARLWGRNPTKTVDYPCPICNAVECCEHKPAACKTKCNHNGLYLAVPADML